MATQDYDPFLKNLTNILGKHGYPDKRVALPLERLYEAAHEKGLNFNKALDMLAEQGIAHEKTSEKIIFVANKSAEAVSGAAANDWQAMAAKAEEMLKSMPPEQLRQIEDLFRNMNDEQKAEMMRKASEMGIPYPS